MPEPIRDLRLTEHRLDYQQFASRVAVSEACLAGMHHLSVNEYRDEALWQTYLELRAFVLTEDASDGPITKSKTETFAFTYAVRPWWLPKFLWKRVPWAEARPTRTVSLTVQPKWKYPHASVVGRLGEPLRLVGAPSFRVRDEFRV